MAIETLTIGKALNTGLRKAMEADPRVVLMGEDIGKLGGVFRITDGLQKDFGEQRVIDTPLAEAGIVGTAVGLAIRGYRPVCEIQFDGFVYPAYDQIVCQVAKMHYRSRGKVRIPMVIRIPYGGGIGAVEHHSESPEAYFAHTAGLKVVSCSNPSDAHWMIQQAIASDDPIVFLEPKRRYWEKGDVETSGTVNGQLPLHSARVVREGTDATIVAYGPMVRVALDAAIAAEEDGRSLEVLDLRSISPLDTEPIFASVRKTGRLVVVHEAPSNVGIGAEIAARVTEQCFYSLEAPVLRVAGFDTPYPASRLEEDFLPDLDRVLDAVDRSFGF
ncbi:MAG TPA: alpha-ketoacid dehydrogenase subunit beta [Micromonosporaceae bacterium]|jgi:pyruvate dehydrogenase E1 component beta subunit|nr:alpha-ketoacid dehydrogenase subunit beta [Micromonosporaceae bacterium]